MREDWIYKKLGEVIMPAKVIKNGSNNNLPILSITMREGIIMQSSRFKKVIASVDTSTYKVVKNGQLVIAFPIDEGLIYTQDIVEAGIMSPAYNVWDVDFSNLDRRYLTMYLHSPFAMNYYKSKLRGTTMRRRSMPKEDLLNMPLPVPPLPAQQYIVHELDKINELISLKKNQLSDLDILSLSIFYDMFGDPIDNSKGWKIKKLDNCLSYIKNGANIKQTKGASGIPITRIETLSGGVFNRDRLGYADIFSTDKYSSYVMEDGDILLSHINSKTNIGRAVIYRKEGNEQIIHGMNLLLLRVIEPLLTPMYLNFFFKTDYFRDKVARIRKDAVNQSSISISDLKKIPVMTPKLSLQQDFAKRMETIEQQKGHICSAIKDLETLLASRKQFWFD